MTQESQRYYVPWSKIPQLLEPSQVVSLVKTVERKVRLGPNQRQVLEILLEKGGTPVKIKEITAVTELGPGHVRRIIFSLRRLIEPDPKKPTILLGRRGRTKTAGYILVPPEP